jgi:hypothetical protein
MARLRARTIVGAISLSLVKRSAGCAMAFVGIVEMVMAVCGYSLGDVLPESMGWTERTLCFLVTFAALCTVIVVWSFLSSRNGVGVEVNGRSAVVSVGDLFTRNGFKIIPFNERFDTDVDDKVISCSSLNGMFIERYADKPSLKRAIESQQETTLEPPKNVDNRLVYPLGTIKPYGDYALLAFTHMDGLEQAHLTKGQYEGCLISMWGELSRTYAGRKVVLPLLGSGITRFDDGQPSDDELLHCMLCTLRASGVAFKEGVEIVLTEQTAQRMRLYEVKGYAESWG